MRKINFFQNSLRNLGCGFLLISLAKVKRVVVILLFCSGTMNNITTLINGRIKQICIKGDTFAKV